MHASTRPAGRDALAVSLGDFLARLHRSWLEEWFVVVDELQISLSQLKALHALSAGELSISTLADRLRLSPPAASRAVDGLVTRGLLERRSCDDDRRARLVRLTPAGEATVERVHAARASGLARFVETLDEAQHASLAATLEQIL